MSQTPIDQITEFPRNLPERRHQIRRPSVINPIQAQQPPNCASITNQPPPPSQEPSSLSHGTPGSALAMHPMSIPSLNPTLSPAFHSRDATSLMEFGKSPRQAFRGCLLVMILGESVWLHFVDSISSIFLH
ncbi:hypothetical protein K458DRAFT_381298 [Lentithecium fluviatile CBS 122367]|uniref:Uncharacterized protein n=1 Tax=Lentithecium fluviatile CBS 122367 TaxID=1168545 RepID=A0A6G1JMR1_9PLEO|nr:hypothetical protein K458DRAFT_381298 [Lentithecium fluviatile CBS 122367]